MLKLVRAFGLCCSTEEAIPLDEEVAFLRALRGLLIKGKGTGEDGDLGDGNGDGGNPKDVDLELRQLLSGALVAEGVTDVFQLAGLNKPDLSILSDQFLAEISKIPQKNLAIALLERLLKQELRSRLKTNKVQQRRFSDMLQASLAKYANRSIDSAKVMEAMVSIAKEFQLELQKGQALGLSPAEVAFYDALAANASAKELMGDAVLCTMAKELADKLRNNLTIDWQYKENVRAKLRIMIKALLKRYKYPPDQEAKAIQEVLQQAETLSEDWADLVV